MPASINDVAKRAKVSISTVSYVLNDGPRRISPEVAERVMQAVKELDYRPSRIARRMVTGKTGTIGIVHTAVPYDLLGGTFLQTVMNGVAIEAQRLRRDLLLHTHVLSDPPEIGLNNVLDGRTDGVVVIAPGPGDTLVDLLDEREFPTVVVAGLMRKGTPYIASDNVQGMELAFRHLYDLGHRRIAITRGHLDSPDGQVRHETYLRLLCEYGLPLEPAWVAGNEFSAKAGYEAAVRVLNAKVRPTAILAGNDEMARSAMIAAQEKGLEVPRDLSVIGFDDTALAQMVSPALTTVHQPLESFGTAAIRLIDSLLENENVPRKSIFPTSLVVRSSTAPPRR